jgi:murein DD-endopeptidase MepM/ murein hydrolase activator NlpD
MHPSDVHGLLARAIGAAALVVPLAVMVVGVPSAGAQSRYERTRELRRDVAELAAREAQAHGALQLAEAEAHRLDAAARKLDRRIHERTAWLSEAAARRERLAGDGAMQARRLKAARGELDRVRRTIVEQAFTASASGAASATALDIVLSVGGVSELSTAVVVVDAVVNAEGEALDQARVATVHMRRVHGAAEAAHLDAESLVDRLAANRGKLVQDRARVGRMRAAAHAAASSGRAVLEDLRKNLWASQAEIAWLGRGAATIEPELRGHQGHQPVRPVKRGTLHTPVHGATFSSGFGVRAHPITGVVRMHTGVDFAVPAGTPILAATDGIVFSATERPAYGLAVVIDHGGRLATVSAHMSGMVVDAGDHVRAGQLIGYVGSTGASTGPHLHFEVRLGGKPVDPAPWF